MDIITCSEVCLRCENEAIISTKNYDNKLCHMEMKFCPYCGLRRFIEFVHREDHTRLIKCFQYGLKLSRASDSDYVGMQNIYVAGGAKVWTRADGHIEFGSFSTDMSDAEAAVIIKRLMSDVFYVDTRSYLSRWNKGSRKLEVLFGKVPENMLSHAPETGLLTGIEQMLEALAMMDEKQRSFH